ncbi:outer membrane vitamin B12 receptor BtuB [Noviherbaspirillum autotrophicum]|uniref:Outer membrane vitamin B12 receptor BtuB n=2 Tax=Noviherbaspirillum autotrophicum TaxID=709839 RepID=A0A0C2BV00_9BURK|nr:outer membrane vitamin B12 receptor BtuB [Noviherbaspirillum autotrophicum]
MTFFTSRTGAAAWTPLALALSAVPAFAQTSPDKTLSPVVVTASRIEQLQTEALPHTTVITAEDIRNSQASDLPSLLQREAGIQITQNGGPGQTTSLFMRGAQPAQTLIMIDGVPVHRQGFANAPALEHILPDQVDHIEIVRGNVSAIYGSGAIGGVIQIFTKHGSGHPASNVIAEVGSRGTFKLTGAASGQINDTHYALSLTRFKTDGFTANSGAQYPNENPDRDGDANNSIAGSVANEWAKGQELGVRIYANEGKFSYDGAGYGGPADIYEGQSTQRTLALFSKNRVLQQWQSTVTLSQTETRNKNASITPLSNSVSRVNSDTSLLEWANEVSLSSVWALTAGLTAARDKVEDSSGSTWDAHSRSASSVYTGLTGAINAHQLQLNVRHDQVGGSGGETTGYFGYGFELTPAVKLIASASTAFHAPTLVQLYDTNYGNPGLKAEHSRSYEIGSQYTVGRTLLRATLFDTRTRDQFGYDVAYKTINLDKVRNQGLELSASTRLADIDLRASLTLQNPKDETTGQRPLRLAQTLASVSLAKSYGMWNFGGDVQYAGSRPDKDFAPYPPTDKEDDAYWLANIYVRYQVAKSISLFGRVENVFNRNYQTAYGYNQPPRGVFVGVNWRP